MEIIIFLSVVSTNWKEIKIFEWHPVTRPWCFGEFNKGLILF